MSETIELVIDESGVVRFLSHESNAATDMLRRELGGTSVRASHIVPLDQRWLRVFRLLRLFGDRGLLAALSRRLPCDWVVDLSPSGGGVMGPFSRRTDAIAAEQAALVDRWMGR